VVVVVVVVVVIMMDSQYPTTLGRVKSGSKTKQKGGSNNKQSNPIQMWTKHIRIACKEPGLKVVVVANLSIGRKQLPPTDDDVWCQTTILKSAN
jgi:hypothetical protein